MENSRLDQLKSGETAVIKTVQAQGALRSRLMDMGLIKGSLVKIIRIAPFGDPMEIEVKGYNLSLRKKEAQNILVEPVQ